MADLNFRTEFRDGGTTVKMIDEEAIYVCSKFTKAQIRTYLQNNRPTIWNFIKNHTTELTVKPCGEDPTRNHYTLMLDRP